MVLNTKRELLVIVLGLIVAFSFGRYSVTFPPQIETKIEQVSHTETEEHKNVHVVTHIVTAKTPEGVVTSETTIDRVITTDKDHSESASTRSASVSTPQVHKKINISALVAMDINNGLRHTYGISVSKEVVGPITVGVWALHTGMLGLSLGLNF